MSVQMICMARVVWFMPALFVAANAFALPRFHPSEADSLLQEQSGSEFESISFAFEFDDLWNDLWLDTELGYRARAGSLSNSRFTFADQVKMAADPYGPLDLSYRAERLQNTVENQELRELRLAIGLPQPWYFSLFGYSESEKKHADIGYAIEYRRHNRQKAEIYFLQIHPMFNGKTADQDRLRRNPFETGLRFRWHAPESWWVAGRFSYHSPLAWERPARGEHYRYARRSAWLELGRQFSDRGRSLAVKTTYDKKEEGLEQLNLESLADDDFSKIGLARVRGSTALRYRDSFAAASWGAGLVLMGRETSSQFERPAANEQIGRTSFWHRDGLAYYYRRWQVDDKGQQLLRFGILANQVRHRGNVNDSQLLESTADLAWEYLINQNSRILFRFAFDMDELVRFFPYKEKTPSWDGGQGQFTIHF